MSSDDQSDKECPLCMEAFDIDDINFYPCNCQYQICRFCWHRIRTNENGLCPACRQSYPEDPVNFQPLSSADVRKIKSEKKQKVQQQKNKVVESRKHLAEFRVLQKNLVYAVGLSHRMADPELLKKHEFFGKFGKIIKIAVGAAPAINSAQPAVHTAYITYTRSEDALRAIHAVNNMVVEGRFLKASLGTTKYCSNFLKGQACHKSECMYLHDVAEDEISFTKEDMHQGKHTEYERRLHEQMGSSSVGSGWGAGGTGGKTKQQQQQSPPPLQQQNSFGSGRELAAMRNKAGTAGGGSGVGRKQTDKKRGVTGSGSLENLPTIATERGRSGTTPIPMTKSSKNNSGGSIHSAANAVDAPNCDNVFDQFASANSLSKGNEQKQNDDVNHGIVVRGSSESLSSAVVSERSSRSIVSTPVPSAAAKGSNSANYTSDDGDEHDDDLGFDPFAESSKALEEIIEEEKNSFPTSAAAHQQMYSNNCSNNANSFHHHHNNPQNHTQQQQHHHQLVHLNRNGPTGSMMASAFHQSTLSSFPTSAATQQMYNNNNSSNGGNINSLQHHHNQQNHTLQQQHHHHHFGSIGMGHNSLGDLRETLRGVASTTMFSNNPQHHHPIGAIGIGQHNSLSDLRESFKALLPNVNVRFVSDAASNGQLQKQQQQQQQRYSGGSSTFFEAVRSAAAEDGQQQQQQRQQQQHTTPSWLPVPPGFSPLFPSAAANSTNTASNNNNKSSN